MPVSGAERLPRPVPHPDRAAQDPALAIPALQRLLPTAPRRGEGAAGRVPVRLEVEAGGTAVRHQLLARPAGDPAQRRPHQGERWTRALLGVSVSQVDVLSDYKGSVLEKNLNVLHSHCNHVTDMLVTFRQSHVSIKPSVSPRKMFTGNPRPLSSDDMFRYSGVVCLFI